MAFVVSAGVLVYFWSDTNHPADAYPHLLDLWQEGLRLLGTNHPSAGRFELEIAGTFTFAPLAPLSCLLPLAVRRRGAVVFAGLGCGAAAASFSALALEVGADLVSRSLLGIVAFSWIATLLAFLALAVPMEQPRQFAPPGPGGQPHRQPPPGWS